MYLLYLDESGDPTAATDHFVVAGLAVHESGLAPLRRRVESILSKNLDAHLLGLEVHAQHINKGKGSWRKVPRPVRDGLLDDLLELMGDVEMAAEASAHLFGVVWSPGAVPSAQPLERAFEEVLLRFDRLVKTNKERGLVVCDKARYERVIQRVATKWRDEGTRFHRLSRLAEVPLFLDSGQSRLTQMADLVAYGIMQGYARGEPRYLTKLLPGFATDQDGTIHSLMHLTPGYQQCTCVACTSRQPRAEELVQDRLFSDAELGIPQRPPEAPPVDDETV